MTKKNGLAAENGAVVDVIRCENDVISFASETCICLQSAIIIPLCYCFQ